MSKTLYLPEHVAQKVNKEKFAAKAETESLESAYVDAQKRVLEPSLLEKSLLERLPATNRLANFSYAIPR